MFYGQLEQVKEILYAIIPAILLGEITLRNLAEGPREVFDCSAPTPPTY